MKNRRTGPRRGRRQPLAAYARLVYMKRYLCDRAPLPWIDAARDSRAVDAVKTLLDPLILRRVES